MKPAAELGAETSLLGMKVHLTSYSHAVETILAWARAGQSRFVCAANVHMVMESYDSESFRKCVNGADLVTPDGVPLVWLLRRISPLATRVYGPQLTLDLIKEAERNGTPVGFLGGAPEVLQALLDKVRSDFPSLKVVYSCSPPFRPFTAIDNARLRTEITQSCASILFVGLGCPKQEMWMSENVAGLPVVMVGVGAAFDFIAKTVRQAPHLIQALGLEWLFRLMQEPRRLWRRYLKHNPRFLLLALNKNAVSKKEKFA